MLRWSVDLEEWPYTRPFIIARVRMLAAMNLVVKVTDGDHIGRGEAEPHESDRATAHQVLADAKAFLAHYGRDLTRETVASTLPACPLRNAIDCALWDLEAKKSGVSVAKLLRISLPERLPITATISMDAPHLMAQEAAEKKADVTILKVKLGGTATDDHARCKAVRAAAPGHRIIIDANEGWDFQTLQMLAPDLKALGVDLIEQPLPAGRDHALSGYTGEVLLCADESVTDTASLERLPGGYSLINIKLDKCGGLTDGIALAKAAKACGLEFMVGSNGGTSLAAAPAYMLANMGARIADIDSPSLLRDDRPHGMMFVGGFVYRPTAQLWG